MIDNTNNIKIINLFVCTNLRNISADQLYMRYMFVPNIRMYFGRVLALIFVFYSYCKEIPFKSLSKCTL